MIDWQQILWDLRRQYKPLRSIALDIGVSPNSIQKIARYGIKTDMTYRTGTALIALHKEHCQHDEE